MSLLNIKSRIRLDDLPTEILFIIFDYLTSDEIIYGFFNINERLNNLLLKNELHLKSLVLPRTNFDIWKNLLSIVGSQIKHLTIETTDLTYPVTCFPNLKSILIILPFGSSDEYIRSIIESDHFQNLNSFKVKKDNLLSNELFYGSTNNQDFILKKIFNNQNSLEIFEYTILTDIFTEMNRNNFMVNLNLHSLILTLNRFEDIFLLIEYTPNLKYLNIHSEPPTKYHRLMNKINIELKELHLKFTYNIILSSLPSDRGVYAGNLLMDIIKRFSSSLICLSLDLVNLLNINSIEKFPFNSRKLQQLLESITQLKQFDLYARINIDQHFILNQFQDQFWFDHNWSFGMHGNYFYTLPFHFNYLYGFFGSFHTVKSNHPDVVNTNLRLWYNVKSLEVLMTHQYDINFVKELKIKMPKLNFIKFQHDKSILHHKTEGGISNNETDGKLSSVTTIQLVGGSIQEINQWLINSLPNVKHLILYPTESSSIDNQLIEILNQRIERLDINGYSSLEELTSISYLYYSNVQLIHFRLNNERKESEWYANIIMKILNNFENLKTLLLYPLEITKTYSSFETKSTKLIKCLDIEDINRNYRIEHYGKYSIFSKK